MTRLLTLLLFGLGLSSNARADFVSGTVVDANGQPVAGVNITARSLGGGGDGHLANAGTNAAGVFNVSIDPGVYDFTFEPPAPPAAVAMITEVENIVASYTATTSRPTPANSSRNPTAPHSSRTLATSIACASCSTDACGRASDAGSPRAR